MVRSKLRANPPVKAIISWLSIALLFGPSLFSQNIVVLKAGPGRELPRELFLAGDFNQWNPRDSNYLFKDGLLSINLSVDSIEAKLCGGDWSLVEGDASGNHRPNRNIVLKDRDSIFLYWYAWERQVDNPPRGVQLLRDSAALIFNGNQRKVWIYLPLGYEEQSQSYPVIYFHDGQNLFDGLQGSAVKWRLAKTLDSLKLPLIAVGIAHGKEERINELSPFPNPEYGGGGGSEYMRFIDKQLIPYIDSNFRTIPGPRHRYIGGSSLGGLISAWALLNYHHRFGGAIVFSPAYWFNASICDAILSAHSTLPSRYLYQMAGDQEGKSPDTMIKNMQDCAIKIKAHYGHWTISTKVLAGGEHNEELWQSELAEALNWLFQQEPLKLYLNEVGRTE